jgi:hypothetical protein
VPDGTDPLAGKWLILASHFAKRQSRLVTNYRKQIGNLARSIRPFEGERPEDDLGIPIRMYTSEPQTPER